MARRDYIYLPTPDEIQLECEKFQNAWSSRERRKRDCSVKPQPWTLPIIEIAVLMANASAASSD